MGTRTHSRDLWRERERTVVLRMMARVAEFPRWARGLHHGVGGPNLFIYEEH